MLPPATPGDMVASLEELFVCMRAKSDAPDLMIGVDCAARTANMELNGSTGGIEALLQAHAVTGFFSPGEQFTPCTR